MPQTDVLIVGSGSAGISAAIWLALHAIPFTILEQRSGPLERGQADGVQCRTVEIYESFGLAEELLREAYHIYEVCFWGVDEQGKLVRKSRAVDTRPGLSHLPHVILNQARMNALMLGKMEGVLRERERERGGGDGVVSKVEYGWVVGGVEVDESKARDIDAYCVRVTAEKDGKEEVWDAKYVLVRIPPYLPTYVHTIPPYSTSPAHTPNYPTQTNPAVQGCDGAHSTVRKALGHAMVGDTSDTVWGVMDIYPLTNFPDIRRKCTLHTSAGNLLIIPREGGSLTRFYIQLPAGSSPKDVTLADLQSTARAIFAPYTMAFASTFWWSAYSIGQRMASSFHGSSRVFLTGDACHTHSPKAGQGMNVSLQDGYNIGWKLGSVLSGRVPRAVLDTYVSERARTAADLIAFDRELAAMFSRKETRPGEFAEYFTQSARYTAGLTARYEASVLTDGAGGGEQGAAAGVTVGMRFPSRQVVRFCDCRPVQLQSVLRSDGRWRVVVFAGDVRDAAVRERLEKVCFTRAYLLLFPFLSFIKRQGGRGVGKPPQHHQLTYPPLPSSSPPNSPP